MAGSVAGPQGKRFGPYTIQNEIASGGQGGIWRAQHDAGHVVALKLLFHPDHSSIKRFQQEARVLARLAHPNLPRVADYGEVNGTPYLASELVDGQDLAALLEAQGIPHFGWTARILITVAQTLQHCHEQGVVHRDLKPANIVVERGTERPVLVDFGLVKRDTDKMELLSLDQRTVFSQSGTIKGTPEYMAPEQINERDFGGVSPRTDVYGLGATLYYMLTGTPPFKAGAQAIVMRKVTRKAPVDPRQLNPQVPPVLAQLCLQSLAKKPADRPKTAAAFAATLAQAAGAPSSAGPPATRADSSSRIRLPSSGPRAGTRLGPYTIQAEIGRGGMGVVLKAQHDDGRLAALKVMSSVVLSESATKRFQREAKTLATLDHPNVVRFLGTSAETPPWLAMEFVPSRDLSALLTEEGPIEFDEAARLVSEAAAGVAHAHDQGVLHRDIKPANILVRDEDDRAVVTDFGLARSTDGGTSRYTKTGDAIGTLAYMAPEQVEGAKDASYPADVWALGAVLYRCLTGENPFNADSSMGLASKIMDARFERPRALAPDVPPDLESVVLSCLQSDPDARPTASEVADALRDRLPIGTLPRRSLRGVFVGAGVLVGALALAGIVSLALDSDPAPEEQTAEEEAAPEKKPPAPSPTDPTPWPKPEATWKPVWSLAAGPAPTLSPSSWVGPTGREAAPLMAILNAKPGEKVPGFLGHARIEEPGIVKVDYDQPEKAVRLEIDHAGDLFLLGKPPAGKVRRGSPGSVRVLAPNDTGTTRLWVGSARWASARVALRLRRVERIDNDSAKVEIGNATLAFDGRTGRVGVAGTKARVQRQLNEGWLEVEFAPGAAKKRRVRLDGQAEATLDPAATKPHDPGPVSVTLKEAHVGVGALTVTGQPARPDLPASARVPGELPTSARIAAAFIQTGKGLGGPFVSLGGTDAIVCELDGPLLVLRRGWTVLATHEVTLGAPPFSGWLLLERQADALHAVVVVGSRRVEITTQDPLPLPTTSVAATYGSTAPRIKFTAVEVHSGGSSPDRQTLDAKAAQGITPALSWLEGAGSDPLVKWRLGALRLARVASVPLGDPQLRGPRARDRRRRAAVEAARVLEEAAPRLEKSARTDALARAVLAWIIAADIEQARASARRLVQEAGLEPAQTTMDRLSHFANRAVGIEDLVQGYVAITDVQVRDAAYRAALELVPASRADILLGLGGNVRNRRPKPDPRTPDGRKALEEAIELMERARAAGHPNVNRINAWKADTYMDLGRFTEGLERWKKVEPRARTWWGWIRMATCFAQLGQTVEALEASLGALAYAGTRRGVVDFVSRMTQEVSPPERYPGLLAVATLGLSRVTRNPGLADRAQRIARTAANRDDRQGDLAAYVLACGGRRPKVVSDRPTAHLARARMGDEGARATLKNNADRDPLVRHLATLDPELSAFVR